MYNFTYTWSWKTFCGSPSDEFQVYDHDHKIFDLCFQYTVFQIPALFCLAIASSYYAGLQSPFILRLRRDLLVLRTRYLVTLALSLLPVVRTVVISCNFHETLHIVDYFLAAVECFTWMIHFLFVIALCSTLGPSLRGPVFVGILWTVNFIFCCFSLYSYMKLQDDSDVPLIQSNFPMMFAGVQVGLQVVYLCTWIPSESTRSSRFMRTFREHGEHAPISGVYARFREDLDPSYLGVALEGTNILSRICFSWVNPLIDKGVRSELNTTEELYELPVSLTCSHLYYQLRKALSGDSLYGTTNRVSLIRALHICFWKEFYGIGIIKFIADISLFGGPLLLHGLVAFIENKNESIQTGCLYAAGLATTSLIGALCIPIFNFKMSMVGLKIRGALSTTVYRKLLALNSVRLSHFSTGELMNFMSVDMDRIVNSCASFHAFWSIPLQLFVTLYLLYQQVGISFIAGVGFSVILMPVNKIIASYIGKLSTKMMTQKDSRILAMSELIRGIKAIKMYLWEKYFTKKINGIRDKELKYLSGRKYLDAMCVYFWATTPVLISISTFTIYVYLGNKLTATVVFTTIALLNMLISPLNAFPWVLNGLTEAWVSLKRVQRLLLVPDLELEHYYDPLPETERNGTVIITDGYFHWGEANSVLENINLRAVEGQLVGIIGPVGAGKSSLLAALLAEVEMFPGRVACSDFDAGFGYVAQTPWLQRGSLRDNILFGAPYDPQKYRDVLEACALIPDLQALPRGDQVIIGDSGCTLSGGQKARIALARAVYQNHQVYLLDDILSAVDPAVASHIFAHCICGLLKSKTRILCTHQHKFLINADHIVLIENGTIVNQGPPSSVLPDYENLVTEAELEAADTSPKKSTAKCLENVLKHEEALIPEEEREYGSLDLSVYTRYIFSIGVYLAPLIFITIGLMQASRNTVDWWLAKWVSSPPENQNISLVDALTHFPDFIEEGNTTSQNSSDTTHYLNIYMSLAGLNSFLTMLRAFLFAFGGIQAAKTVHNRLLTTVIQAKMSFFDSTSCGRILNRFSSDLYTIDDSLPFILNILLAQFFGLMGMVVMIVYGLPWMFILGPLIPVYHWLQNRYRLTSRELKRLSSITLSPLYSHFTESIQGIVTIRALRASSRFKRDNSCWLEANQKAQLSSNAASQWLAFRLQMIASAIVTMVGFLAIAQHYVDVADAGLVGLAISYALSLTNSLAGVINAFTETERELVSMERIDQYLDPEREILETENLTHSLAPPSFGWPWQGSITFSRVFMRYANHLPYALSGVSFETRQWERVGIVGRTGAGKSSIISSLFRLNDISEGSILIDQIDISSISIAELRSRIGIIPQDPFIFSGTVKENLDPDNNYSDSEIWIALHKAHVYNLILDLGGLDANLKKTSLSSGQCQLFCLARAILYSPRIICIDEATANVDNETDRLMQNTIKNCFRQSTVLTIAHRVSTILDSDRVLVMGEGRVLEFDSPNKLLQDPQSHFYQLVNSTSC